MKSATNCKIDLLESESLSVPGGGKSDEGVLPIQLSPKYRINRLAFNLSPQKLDKNYELCFQIKYDVGSFVKFDILRGDIGFPEISFFNSENEVYRLKRGNFKDFVNRNELNRWQSVKVPLSILIYHVDLKDNTLSDLGFFEAPVVKIVFDFLSSNEEIKLHLSDVTIKETEIAQISLDDLLKIERVAATKNFEDFLSERDTISLSVVKNDIAKFLYPGRFELKISGNNASQVLELHEKKEFFSLSLKRFGDNVYDIEGVNGEHQFSSSLKICRTMPREVSLTKFIGFSDEFRVEKCYEIGSGLFRIVVNLRAVLKDNGKFRFPSGQDPFRLLNRGDIDYWISLKGIPSWLSTKEGRYDSYRYGPKNYEEYKKLLVWIFQKAKENNVKVVELWNEANVIHEWNDTFDVLAKMCEVSKEARDQTFPGCKIASPSSTSWDFAYFEKLKNHNIFEFVDYFALHAYTYQPEEIGQQFAELKKFLEIVGKKDLRVAITEIGFRTPAFSEKEQAQYLFAYSAMAYVHNFVDNIFWFRIENPRYESLSSYDQNSSGGYALIGNEGKYVRPAFAAFRFLTKLIADQPISGIKKVGSMTILELASRESIFRIVINVNKSCLKQAEGNVYFDCFGNEISFSDTYTEKVFIIKGM